MRSPRPRRISHLSCLLSINYRQYLRFSTANEGSKPLHAEFLTLHAEFLTLHAEFLTLIFSHATDFITTNSF